MKKLLNRYIVLANYSIPVQSLTSDDDDSSTDRWRYYLTAFLIFECTFAKQCVSIM